MSLVEVLVALLLVGLALLVAASVVTWGERLEARTERRAVALDVAESALELVRIRDYEQVRTGRAAVSVESVRSVLPDVEAHLDVVEDEDLGLKTVTCEVWWAGKEPGRVELTTQVGSVRGASR